MQVKILEHQKSKDMDKSNRHKQGYNLKYIAFMHFIAYRFKFYVSSLEMSEIIEYEIIFTVIFITQYNYLFEW